MSKNFPKVMQICKEIFPEINFGAIFAATAATIINFELEAVACQIHQKYFEPLLVSTDVNTTQNSALLASLQETTNQSVIISPTNEDVWIFGYGSLVWKADFPYIDRRKGFIRGYQRRFYQNSLDHRGTPEKPGRVVTLLSTDCFEDRVYGVAYRIAAEQKADVLAHLDYREKNGYQRCKLEFQEFPEETGQRWDIIMYIATKENESYAGDVWQLEKIADQIFTSAGPSGANREYLFNLANAMRALFPGVEDTHLFDLEKVVRSRIEKDEAVLLERAVKKDISELLRKAADLVEEGGDGQSEVIRRFTDLRQKCCTPGWKESLLARELLSRTDHS